jgi:hypothetical protein
VNLLLVANLTARRRHFSRLTTWFDWSIKSVKISNSLVLHFSNLSYAPRAKLLASHSIMAHIDSSSKALAHSKSESLLKFNASLDSASIIQLATKTLCQNPLISGEKYTIEKTSFTECFDLTVGNNTQRVFLCIVSFEEASEATRSIQEISKRLPRFVGKKLGQLAFGDACSFVWINHTILVELRLCRKLKARLIEPN